MSESNSHLRPFKKRLIELQRNASLPASPVVVPSRRLTPANATSDTIVTSDHHAVASSSRPYSAPSVLLGPILEQAFEPVPSPTINLSDVPVISSSHAKPRVPKIQMPTTDLTNSKVSGDTPRSGVRVKISESAGPSETDEPEDESSGDEKCIYSSTSMALALESIRKTNRKTAMLQASPVTNDDVPAVSVPGRQETKVGKQEQPMIRSRSQRKMSRTSYLEFVIRPLTLGDYNSVFIQFLSKVSAFEAAASSSPPRSVRSSLTPLLLSSNELTATNDVGFAYFSNLMIERKRTKHFTLIALVSGEQQQQPDRVIALGSIFFTYKVGSILAHQNQPQQQQQPKKSTKTKGTMGYIDEILVDPFYQDTQLYEKMLYRLIEIAEMMKDVSHVVVCCDENFISLGNLLPKVHSCKLMGQTYKIALRK